MEREFNLKKRTSKNYSPELLKSIFLTIYPEEIVDEMMKNWDFKYDKEEVDVYIRPKDVYIKSKDEQKWRIVIMTDKYEFMCIVDDSFKECKTIQDINFRFIEMQNILKDLFNQNIGLKVAEDKRKMSEWVDILMQKNVN